MTESPPEGGRRAEGRAHGTERSGGKPHQEGGSAAAIIPESLETLSAIINAIADPIFIKDGQHRWVLLNDACCQLIGHSRQELLGKSDYEFFPKQQADIFWQKDEEVLNTGRGNVNEEDITDANGITRRISTKKTAYTDSLDNRYIVGIIRDISAIRNAEDALNESREYLNSILNSIGDPVFVKDREHRWMLLNDAYCEFMGYGREELIGKSDFDYFPAKEAKVFWEKDEVVFNSGQENTNEERFTDHNGVTHTIITKKTLYKDRQGNMFIVGVIRDITERKRQELELERYRQKLEDLVDERTGELMKLNETLKLEIVGRKRIEDALRASEEGLHQIMEQMPYAVLVSRTDGTASEVNRAYLDIFGGTSEDIVGKYNVLKDRTIERLGLTDEAKAAFLGQTIDLQEVEVPAGTVNPQYREIAEGPTKLAVLMFPVFTPQGRISRVVTLFRDITARKNAENALRDSEERYRQLVELAPDGIAVHSGGKIVFANTAGATMLRAKSPQDLVGRTMMELVHPDFRQVVMTRVRQMTDELKDVPLLEEKFLRIDGSPIDVEVAAMPMTFAAKPAMQVIFRDITDRKNAENALRQSEEKYRALAESAQDYIFTIGADERVQYVNAFSAREFGCKPDDLVGKHVNVLFPAKTYQHQIKAIRSVFAHGKPVYSENHATFPDKRLWLDTWLTPIRDREGKVVSILGISRDVTDRKSADEALHESEEKYRSLINTLPHTVAIHQDNKLVFANNASLQMFGYKDAKGLIGSHILSFVAKGERRRLSGYLRARITGRGNAPTHYFTRLIRSNGEEFPGELFVKNTLFEGRAAKQIIVLDITERVKAEEAMMESERRYRTTINSMKDAIHLVGPDMRIILANKALTRWNRQLGLRTDVLGLTPFEVYPFLPQTIGDEYRRVFRSAKMMVTEDVSLIFGVEVITETRKIPVLEGGKVTRVVTVIRDITDSKMAEKRVLDIKAHLETILDGISESIVVLDRRYHIVSYNRAFQEWVGRSGIGCVGSKCFGIIHGNSRACRKCVVRNVFKTGKPSESIHYHQEGKGRKYHEVRAYPIRISGKIGEAIYVFRDVTEREHMKEQLAQNYEQLVKANEELMKLDRMKSEFLAIASHELRTPLAIIKGYADILASGNLGPLNQEQEGKLNRIANNVEQLNILVNNILDLTRMDSGELSMALERFSLERLIREVTDDMEQIATVKGVRLKTRVTVRSMVRADRGRMNQLLVNLIDNALKFTPEGGTITVSASETAKATTLRVADTGIGIKRKELSNIFLRFYQVDSTVQRRYKGAGLGLAICKRIAELHGGQITVKSRYRHGTTMTVTLPKRK
jgi:PAS domain S-box-containing protein